MLRTYLYKVDINKRTEFNCNKWLYLCRSIYNLALEQRINMYRQRGRYTSFYDQQNQLPELKREFREFKIVDAQCLQDVLKRLDLSFRNFYRRIKNKNGKPGFPRFKSKNRYNSFTLKQNSWVLDGKYLDIRNVGRFKLFLSRPIPIQSDIKTVTVKRSPTGKWFVSFSCDNVPKREFPKTEKEVGIDVGIKNFCVDSDANFVRNPRFLKDSLKLLRKRQRSLSRKKKGSKGRNKTRMLVAKTHEKISNQRKDFLHKISNYYIRNYKSIYVENLNINGMIRNRCLSRSISDSSWGIFFNYLSYKAEEAGREVVKVSPNNTSQICSRCGEKVPKGLYVREHSCTFCNLIIDRDLNASLNILTAGQAVQAVNPQVGFV